MKLLFFTFFIGMLSIESQSEAFQQDFYTKKGFVASGYDLVSYFDKIVLKGNEENILTLQGLKFKFSSKKNLLKFKANPEQYLPQYGGYCAYAVGKKRKKVSVDPETYEIRDGKLYLFYNSWGTNTLKLWQENNPEDLKNKADQYWNEIIKTD